MPLLKDEAFVIAATDWRETSRIIRCFAREQGKIGLVAKGARSAKSQIGSAFESFSRIRIVVYAKPGADLFTLKEAETAEYFPAIRKDLIRFAAASFFFEILDKGLAAHERNEALFDLTANYLHGMNAEEWGIDSAPPYFLQLVAALGFAPHHISDEFPATAELRSLIGNADAPERWALPLVKEFFSLLRPFLEYHFEIGIKSADFLLQQIVI